MYIHSEILSTFRHCLGLQSFLDDVYHCTTCQCTQSARLMCSSELAWSITSAVPNVAILIKAHLSCEPTRSNFTKPYHAHTPHVSLRHTHLPSYLIKIFLAFRCDTSTTAIIPLLAINIQVSCIYMTLYNYTVQGVSLLRSLTPCL